MAVPVSALGPRSGEAAILFGILDGEHLRFAILDVNGSVIGDRRRKYLPARGERPFQFAVGADSVELVVQAPEIDRAVFGYRRCGADGPARLKFPFEAAVGRDCIDVAIVASKIHRAIVCDRRRHGDVAGNEERPLPCAIGVDGGERAFSPYIDRAISG